MYQALYRKWRPQTFDQVVGQKHITETLKNQVKTGRLSHAYLFIGTRGTGKTTCARILAKRGELRASGERQPLRSLPRMPRDKRRLGARCCGARRGVQQRR